MAFAQPGYVVSLINSKNQVLREKSESGTRTIRMPFNEEYKIRIKNKTNARAYVRVEIDGMEVTPDRKFILRADETLDLERFMLDGDLTKGNRFKFISVKDGMKTGEVQDPTSPQNGVVKVTFLPEQVFHTFFNVTNSQPQPWNPHNPWITTSGGNIGDSTVYGSAKGGGAGGTSFAVNSSVNCVEGHNTGSGSLSSLLRGMSLDQNPQATFTPPKDAGATGQGSESTQQFQNSHEFFVTGSPIEMVIHLKGLKEPQPVVTAPAQPTVTVTTAYIPPTLSPWKIVQIGGKPTLLWNDLQLPVDDIQVGLDGLTVKIKKFEMV